MEKKNGFHQPENLRCQLSFTPNSNNGFYQQQYSSDLKINFSTKQKIGLRQPDEGH